MYEDALAELEVLTILDDDVIEDMDFSLGGVRVTPSDLRAVRRAISGGRIRVWRGGGATMAMYEPENDSFMVPANVGSIGTTFRSRIEDEALVIHEAIHASRDLARATLLPVADEAAAYVAQMYWLWLKDAAPAETTGTPGSAVHRLGVVLNAAFAIATRIGEGHAVSDESVSSLYDAVRRILVPNPLATIGMPREYCPYESTAAREYDGVGT